MPINKVNLNQKLGLFSELWSPKVVGELNGQHVKLVKLKGEFVWHHYQDEDELFFVIRGQLIILFRDEEVIVNPGEFVIVPKGVEHKPVAHEEVDVMLLEPASTINTGNVKSNYTVEALQHI